MPNGKAQKERSFEIGKDESWFVNNKALFDELLKHLVELSQTSVESVKRNRTIVDKILSDAQQHDNAKQVIAEQALQNAVETANMVGKQAVRHSDIAINGQWTYSNELGILLGAKSGAQADAFIVLLAKAIADVMKEKK